MTRDEYIDHLTAIYSQANRSDTTYGEVWQHIDDCVVHCKAIEVIARNMMNQREYSEWLDRILAKG